MQAVATSAPYLTALAPVITPNNAQLTDDGCSLGRGSTCSVVVPRSVVSRLHAQIERSGARFQLRDLGSVNGTYVNGVRLHDAHLLRSYDAIGLGEPTPLLTFIDPDSTDAVKLSLTYDERTMRFSLHGAELELTPNQFRLLRHLHVNRDRVCSREHCAVAVWGDNFAPGMDATTLDRLVSTLRATLRRASADSNVIVTRPGLGFQLAEGA